MGEQSLQELKDRGKAALRDKDLDLAIESFSEVLKVSQDAETFLERARAYRKQKSSLLEAAEDAKHACRLDPTKAVAYVEQGKILYELEEYESAKKCFETALSLEPGKKLVQNWLGMCCVALGEKVPESSTEGDGEQQRLIKERVEDIQMERSSKVGPSRVKIDDEEYRKYWSAEKAPSAQVPVAKRFDHCWFQSPTGVEVDILAKNVNPETVHVEFSTDSVHVQVRNASLKQDEPEYSRRFDLFGQIDPTKSTYEVLKTKIEIKMRKKDTSVQWGSLEKSSEQSIVAAVPSLQPPITDQRRKGTKDWSKIEKQIAGEDEEEKDSNVLDFFQKLYAGADEDTRRAMMKSYQESGGTSLSTNWKDVSSKDFSKEND
eukprot:jgi/Picsp_1/5403/NSC_02763-R1_protein sgt1 homolog